MRPLLLSSLVLLLGSPLAGEEGTASSAATTPTPITLTRYTLTDGRILTGIYDEESGQLTLHDDKTGKRIAQMALAADTIQGREALVITPPDLANLPAGANGSWITNYEKAKELGAELTRPILLDFTGSDWCGWCVKLDKEVFAQKEFKTWAAAKVILVKIDFPRRKPLPEVVQRANEDLSKRFGVTGFPTVHIVDAQTGTSLRQWGYKEGGPKLWVESMIQGVPALRKLAWID